MAVAGCSTLTPTQDPVQLRLTDLEARLVRIEKVIDNDSLLQLANDVSDLQTEVQSLRGDVETLRHDTEDAATRQRDLYLDVDQRLQTIEQAQARAGGQQPAFGSSQSQFGASNQTPSGQAITSQPPAATASSGQLGGAAVAPAGGGAAPVQPAGTDQDNYNKAFELIQARHYDDAAAAFEQFLVAFPSSPLADNAQYWLAETYYVRSQFDTALAQFQKVIDTYPQSSKLADALLKVGYCNYELKRWDAARQALQRVTRDFPDTTAARLAAQRLDRIAREAG